MIKFLGSLKELKLLAVYYVKEHQYVSKIFQWELFWKAGLVYWRKLPIQIQFHYKITHYIWNLNNPSFPCTCIACLFRPHPLQLYLRVASPGTVSCAHVYTWSTATDYLCSCLLLCHSGMPMVRPLLSMKLQEGNSPIS